MVAMRRRMLTAAAAGGLIAGAAFGVARAQPARKTFVLVHGAFCGGWIWRRVADRLEQDGHKVFVPTLTGLGERSHLLQEGHRSGHPHRGRRQPDQMGEP